MAQVSTYVKEKNLQAWLQRFFDRMDQGRRRRGEALYREGRVAQLKNKAFGFTAEVRGSVLYQVSAFFGESEKGERLPRIDDTLLTCSCPDGSTYCKHIIAALIAWSVQHEQTQQVMMREQTRYDDKRTESLRPTLVQLKRLAEQKPAVTFDANNAIDWPFSPPLAELLRTMQNLVKNDIMKQG
ncbi:SWIM zinc finger domain-containing protein [Camelliibacillus cellulosilyticus]|uniref:SWIM zinc finger domain-containing protein n=1 Tax=Camelliibacillus cellulosilyticus TaxID=2174486 RepID=A0ABV9GNU3_9BACL